MFEVIDKFINYYIVLIKTNSLNFVFLYYTISILFTYENQS